jgi:hypothetical protein
VLPPSQEEIDIAIKSLQERDGIENPSHAEARQFYYGVLEEERREKGQVAANFISSHFGELCNLMMKAVVETAKIHTLQQIYLQKGAARIDAQKARDKILLVIWPFIRDMLDIPGPGGDKRSSHNLAEETEVPRQRIDELTPLWNYIVKYQAEYEDVDGWYRDMMEEEEYQELSSVCPDLTLDFILSALRNERKPSALAFLHTLSETAKTNQNNPLN